MILAKGSGKSGEEDVISFSSLPFSVPCGSMEWGSMKERQPTLHCNLVGHINTGVGGDD